MSRADVDFDKLPTQRFCGTIVRKFLPGEKEAANKAADKAFEAPKPSARCRNYKRYKGMREPRCHGGYGCYACWKRYFYVHDEEMR